MVKIVADIYDKRDEIGEFIFQHFRDLGEARRNADSSYSCCSDVAVYVRGKRAETRIFVEEAGFCRCRLFESLPLSGHIEARLCGDNIELTLHDEGYKKTRVTLALAPLPNGNLLHCNENGIVMELLCPEFVTRGANQWYFKQEPICPLFSIKFFDDGISVYWTR